jgi:hypothetical protein
LKREYKRLQQLEEERKETNTWQQL